MHSMKRVVLLLLLVSGCCADPVAPPPDFAVLDHLWVWRVQLSDGTRCDIPFAFWWMEYAPQAIAKCRGT